MGLRDKKQIEQLTSRVIERMEHYQPLPGMEDLVSKSSRQRKALPTKAEIQAIVKDILANESPVTVKVEKPEEDKPMAEPIMRVKYDVPSPEKTGITLTENALQVLEKRYLKRINRVR